MTPERVVVVGGGLAGHVAVTTLRQEGFTRAIALLTEEEHLPYDRPPLSKELLTGAISATTLPADYDALGVEVITGSAAVGLRPGAVVTETGTLPYDGLILATGSVPRRLPGQPAEVFELRTYEDATRLRTALRTAASAVVVGAGWIGAEVASSCRTLGCRVSVVDVAATPLAQALPAEIATHIASWYADHGVTLFLDSVVTGVEGDGVSLADGQRLDADVVVVGIGARPRTDWLRDSDVTLHSDGAVVVDEHLYTGVPGIFAAGDIARWPSARFGTHLRLEHWDHASASAQAAARNLLGVRAAYDPVPYFWSDQFGHRLQYVGHGSADDDLILRGDPNGDEPWSVVWLNEGQLRATLAVDQRREIMDARRLIMRGARLDPARAADASVRLTDAAILGPGRSLAIERVPRA